MPLRERQGGTGPPEAGLSEGLPGADRGERGPAEALQGAQGLPGQ